MKRQEQSRRRLSLRVYLLAAFALVMLLGLPLNTRAQWTTPDSNNNIHNTNSGNVGIGTASPASKLSVTDESTTGTRGITVSQDTTDAAAAVINLRKSRGTATSPTTVVSGDYTAAFTAQNYDGTSYLINGNFGYRTSGTIATGSVPGQWFFAARTSSDTDPYSNGTVRMVIGSDGNVGIGTTAPNQTLTASGYSSTGFGSTAQIIGVASSGTAQNQLNITSSTNAWGLILGQNNTGVSANAYHCASCAHIINFNNASLFLGTNNTERLTITGGGNIGIGTTSPGTLNGVNFSSIGLHLKGTGASKYLAVDDSTNVGVLLNDSSQAADSRMWAIFNQQSRFSISSFSDAGAATEKVSVLRNGNVGIGTTTPTAKLDVNGTVNVTGDINVTGNINASYQDVAEWVPVTHALPAGTVVVLNPTHSNQVMASASAYDTRVAGVISARPGLALGEAGTDKALVATTGRVKVKVDATRVPIHIGDLLVTSDKEGVAMKSEPLMIQGRPFHSPGTLIGKALEPLEKGTAEILVLLSLQ